MTSDQVTIAWKNQVFDSANPYLILAKNSEKFGSSTLSSSNIACISTDSGPLPNDLRVVKTAVQDQLVALNSVGAIISDGLRKLTPAYSNLSYTLQSFVNNSVNLIRLQDPPPPPD